MLYALLRLVIEILILRVRGAQLRAEVLALRRQLPERGERFQAVLGGLHHVYERGA